MDECKQNHSISHLTTLILNRFQHKSLATAEITPQDKNIVSEKWERWKRSEKGSLTILMAGLYLMCSKKGI